MSASCTANCSNRWRSTSADHEIGRDYRLQTDERCKVAIYAQGFSQASHGLSDTLLSVLPVRAEEISGSLYQHLKPGAPARALHEHALAS